MKKRKRKKLKRKKHKRKTTKISPWETKCKGSKDGFHYQDNQGLCHSCGITLDPSLAW